MEAIEKVYRWDEKELTKECGEASAAWAGEKSMSRD